MSDLKITVGGAIEEGASSRFADAWHRAERGETFQERHLAFESWDALAPVLSGKRMEPLRYVRRHNVTSIRALAKALSRDYSNVHLDVQALAAAGLLDATDGGVRSRRAFRTLRGTQKVVNDYDRTDIGEGHESPTRQWKSHYDNGIYTIERPASSRPSCMRWASSRLRRGLELRSPVF